MKETKLILEGIDERLSAIQKLGVTKEYNYELGEISSRLETLILLQYLDLSKNALK